MNFNPLNIAGRRWRDLLFLSGWYRQKWPDHLYIIRHGLSAANIERERALAAGESELQLTIRDVDIPLDANKGQRQTDYLGNWFASLAENERPTVFLTSPFRRARETKSGIVASAGGIFDHTPEVFDERLGERECGILEGLTKVGVRERLPTEAARRDALGKLYYRPPGGESWADVILRLRSVIDMIVREYPGERVAITCHSVVVACFRYLLERHTEESILRIDREEDIPNASVTHYQFDRYAGRRGKLVLRKANFLAPGLETL
ncbi:MAG: histidine phosphatase family protein [Candidatus Obscuribacterales bacterium]|nr:histidine phosphatase family protein [Candidatus Obscuribacterales bacterium]